ncbi:hypothetical protein [Streptacidiphilus melanogenes]|uniref:hypothetical protein n=1 Tax=Streptacidiphilus melanogenes TaxID=411235 RepID=UPI001269A175|nr:hypothetical protein [Streptacidiphilus melanogenes]
MDHSTHARVDQPLTPLETRLAALRGGAAARNMDARALAALAANPGCDRRAVLDAAGVDKAALATRLGSPATFGQSPFAITRGLVFERRLRAERCAELVALLRTELLPEATAQSPVEVPDLLPSEGPAVRAARTRVALAEATANAAAGRAWTLLDRPLLRLDVAGSTVSLEPDAIVIGPDGRWTVVEIKSFPILDGSADPTKVGAAARQAAVYVLALRTTAAALDAAAATAQIGPGLVHPRPGTGPAARPHPSGASADVPGADVPRAAAHAAADAVGSGLSPADATTPAAPRLPTAVGLPSAATSASAATPGAGAVAAGGTASGGPEAALPAGAAAHASPYAEPVGLAAAVRTTGLLVCPRDFSNVAVAAPLDLRKQLAVTRRQLARMTRIETLLAALPETVRLDEAPEAVDTLAHAYAPECLAACELAFHCRTQARAAGAVEVLGRGVRGELGSLTTVEAALEATAGDGALARAARLREEALAR